MIIDGNNLILGRMATYAAKQVMLGNKVDIINCEKIVISGDKRTVLGKYQNFRVMGVQPNKGPFQPRMPDRFVRRVIRRMLPIRRTRGRDALREVMCHIGIPKEFEGKETQEVKYAKALRLSTLKYTTVGYVCEEMGSKIYTHKRV